MAPQHGLCYCDICGPEGQKLPYNRYRFHLREQKRKLSSQEIDSKVESDLAEDIVKLVLTDPPPSPLHVPLPVDIQADTPISPSSFSTERPATAQAVADMQLQLHPHLAEIDQLLQKATGTHLPTGMIADIQRQLMIEKKWLVSYFYDIRKVYAGRQRDVQELQYEMTKQIMRRIQDIEQFNKSHCINADAAQTPVFQMDEYFVSVFDQGNAIITTVLFLVVALNVLGRVTREWCNLLLRVIRTVLQSLTIDNRSEELPSAWLDFFPSDIRTARDLFDPRVKTKIYACCPECSYNYEPIIRDRIVEYPARCTNTRTPGSKPCNARVTKMGVQNKESVRVPIRPYVMQDYNSFLANWLSQPGMEKLLERSLHTGIVDFEINDITQGKALMDLCAPDGLPFLISTSKELRLAWALSVDWFNPFHNKAAGKSASVGVITLSCLNLPPHLRHKAENLYIAGIIPGPHEPSLDEVNHFLKPIVDVFEPAYVTGTKFSRTCSQPKGRLVRSAITVIVSDLPAARKVTGAASHSASSFCSTCTLDKKEINSLNMTKWVERTHAKQLEAAKNWRDATSQAERSRIFSADATRWSEAYRFSNLDITKSVVVDGMHDLFLGLTQYHCRTVLGLESTEPARQDQEISQIEMEKIESLLLERRFDRIEHLVDLPILRVLCANRHIRVNPSVSANSKQVKKSDMLEALKIFVEGTTENFEEPLIVGDAAVDEAANSKNDGMDYYRKLNRHERWHVQQVIQSVTRPDWHSPPPSNFGSQSHGKLKADQWRSCIEFDIPVALARIANSSKAVTSGEYSSWRRRLYESTMYLAMAIRWGTSRVTSPHHEEKYTSYMLSYLTSLRSLYPHVDLTPNHHNALHIGKYLLLFGPMHGWWSYPLERLIGVLQRVQTNSKLGQMERTMLQSLSTASNIKTFFRRSDCPELLEKCKDIFDMCWDDDGRGTLMTDLRALHPETDVSSSDHDISAKSVDWEKSIELPSYLQSICNGANSIFLETLGMLPDRVFVHSRHVIMHMKFADFATSSSQSLVFFIPSKMTNWIPGRIRQIISVLRANSDAKTYTQYWFFIIHRFKTLDNREKEYAEDPFKSYPDFDITLWSDNTVEVPDIMLAGQSICHAVACLWSEGVLAMKPLNRIS